MVSGSSANINDYTGAGLYWMNKTTVTNTPNGGSGMLIVTTSPTGNVIYQTFVSFNTSSGYVATRCYTNSQWYNWDERPGHRHLMSFRRAPPGRGDTESGATARRSAG